MSEKYSPFLRFVIAGLVPVTLYKTHYDDGVKQKIRYARNFLKENPEWNFMIYQNHITEDDPLFGGHVAYLIDPPKSRHLFAPVSASHTIESDDNSGSEKIGFNKLAQRCGVETIPVVQTYQVDNPNYSYTKEQAMENYKLFVGRLNELRKSDQPLGCIITPEGHRSETEVLGKGEKGVEHIAEKLKPIIAIPLGISSDEKLETDKKNFGKRINLSMGEIWLLDKNSERKTVDDYMTNLAMALPPRMRGQYGEE